MADIRRKFMEFDQDSNGYVSVDEVHLILGRELSFTPEQSLQYLRRYDRNHDGKLSYEEFVRFYNSVRTK